MEWYSGTPEQLIVIVVSILTQIKSPPVHREGTPLSFLSNFISFLNKIMFSTDSNANFPVIYLFHICFPFTSPSLCHAFPPSSLLPAVHPEAGKVLWLAGNLLAGFQDLAGPPHTHTPCFLNKSLPISTCTPPFFGAYPFLPIFSLPFLLNLVFPLFLIYFFLPYVFPFHYLSFSVVPYDFCSLPQSRPLCGTTIKL